VQAEQGLRPRRGPANAFNSAQHTKWLRCFVENDAAAGVVTMKAIAQTHSSQQTKPHVELKKNLIWYL